MKEPLLIVNPASGGGNGERRRALLEGAARERWPGLSLRLTGAPGDAERFARAWAESGARGPVIASGGDGTIHEVLNGLAATGFSNALGILPAGTGNDFARNSGELRVVDLGRLRFTAPSGAPQTRIFANAASIGVVPRANRIAHQIRRGLPGRLRYRVGGLAALLGGRAEEYRVRSDGSVLFEGPALSLTFANGESFGGGMRISPGSRLDDGALDLVTIGALGLPRALLALARVERGGHVAIDGVRVSRLEAPAVVEGPSGVQLLEADGEEFLAVGPVEVDVLPGVLTLVR